MKLARPEALWLLWLVPLLALFYLYVFRAKARALAQFATPEILQRILSGVSRRRQKAKAALVLVGLLAAVLCLAEVKYGFTWETVTRKGVDIVVALDVSDSMLVEDAGAGGKLTRLERAKRKISDLLRMLQGDRIGLVAFAGEAFVQCPLTLDYAAAAIFLDDIDTELIPVKGTAIGTALATSLKALDGGANPASRAIILITDGEDHSGQALAAAEAAKAQGVRIFPIGIGRDEGAPIPAPDGGFRKDRRGEVVMSKLDEPTLQKIALTTGGRYVRSVTGDMDLEQIYSQGIRATLEAQELGSKRRQHWRDRFQWLLMISVVALAVEPLIAARQRRRGALLSALVLLVVSSQMAHAQTAPAPPAAAPAAAPSTPAAATAPRPSYHGDGFKAYESGAYDQALQAFTDVQVDRPGDPAVMLNIGSAHYKMNNFAAAEQSFAAAALAGPAALRAQAYYNLGNCAYRQGKLDEAVAHYQAALELNPNDADSKFNLEFVRDEIRRRHEEAQKRAEQQQQQKQNQAGANGQPEQQPKQPEEAQPTPPAGEQQPKEQQQQQQQQSGAAPGEAQQGEQQAEPPGGAAGATDLTPEQAERYLQALGYDRPRSPARQQTGRRAARRYVEKDW